MRAVWGTTAWQGQRYPYQLVVYLTLTFTALQAVSALGEDVCRTSRSTGTTRDRVAAPEACPGGNLKHILAWTSLEIGFNCPYD